MEGCGLSNKVCGKHLQGDTLLAIHFTRGGTSMLNKVGYFSYKTEWVQVCIVKGLKDNRVYINKINYDININN